MYLVVYLGLSGKKHVGTFIIGFFSKSILVTYAHVFNLLDVGRV
jgi:hypothetical protein